MSRFVLDCSVAVAWCFEDEADRNADAVLDRLAEDEALVPSLWPLEVANALLVAERRGRLSEADTTSFLALLSALPITVDETTAARATGAILAVARRHNLSVYDAAYLDLAMREDAPLASRDQPLRAAAEASGVSLLAAG